LLETDSTHLITQLLPHLSNLLIQQPNLTLQMPRPLLQTQQHPHGRREILVILITDPFNLVFLFLHEGIQATEVELGALGVLEGLDEWREGFKVFGRAVGFVEGYLQDV
jgi:hypothetical protein